MLLGCESRYVCHDLTTEKQRIYFSNQNIKQDIDIELTLVLEIKLQKDHF